MSDRLLRLRETVRTLYAMIATGDVSALPSLIVRHCVPHCSELNVPVQPEPGLEALGCRLA